jgi:hypothetical protein
MSAISSLKMHFELFGVAGLLKRASVSISGGYPELLAKLPNRQGAAYVRMHTTDVLVFQHADAKMTKTHDSDQETARQDRQ